MASRRKCLATGWGGSLRVFWDLFRVAELSQHLGSLIKFEVSNGEPHFWDVFGSSHFYKFWREHRKLQDYGEGSQMTLRFSTPGDFAAASAEAVQGNGGAHRAFG